MCPLVTIVDIVFNKNQSIRKANITEDLHIHPGGIEILLNSRLGASSRLEDLGLGCQNTQQIQKNHLDGLHLITRTCRQQTNNFELISFLFFTPVDGIL